VSKNPYKYLGPLDPIKDKPVLVPRAKDLNRVTAGIKAGEYWGIFGLRQIGKSTFLRQIKHALRQYHSELIDFEVSPSTEEQFYEWLTGLFSERIPSDTGFPISNKWSEYNPDFKFIKFLEEFKPTKKVLLLFDEIEGIPSLENFLRILRQIYHRRDDIKHFRNYAFVIAGSSDLISLTEGKNSAFNIAKFLYLDDFSREEAIQLIDQPFKKLNNKMDSQVEPKLFSLVHGHPQILQHACHHLFEIASDEHRDIHEKDVDDAIEAILKNNTTIDNLGNEIRKDKKLESLVKSILKGEIIKYLPYKEYSIKGGGPIIEDEKSSCKIRNGVYKRYLRDILDVKPAELRFKQLKKLGGGLFSEVFKAIDTTLDRTVAIKRIRAAEIDDQTMIRNLIEEARITARLEHSNIVRIYDIIQIDIDPVIVMEYIEGLDYCRIIKKRHPLKMEEILRVAISLFEALSYAHSKGIIHRDIKPANIMLDEKEGQIKVVDFGIAVLKVDSSLTKSKYIEGTPYYISPEQIKGETVDQRTDIYSAGAFLFHLTSGTPPFFDKDNEKVLSMHLKAPIPSLKANRDDISIEFDRLVKKCMEKDKENRFNNTEEVLKLLKDFYPATTKKSRVELSVETEISPKPNSISDESDHESNSDSEPSKSLANQIK